MTDIQYVIDTPQDLEERQRAQEEFQSYCSHLGVNLQEFDAHDSLRERLSRACKKAFAAPLPPSWRELEGA